MSSFVTVDKGSENTSFILEERSEGCEQGHIARKSKEPGLGKVGLQLMEKLELNAFPIRTRAFTIVWTGWKRTRRFLLERTMETALAAYDHSDPGATRVVIVAGSVSREYHRSCFGLRLLCICCQ